MLEKRHRMKWGGGQIWHGLAGAGIALGGLLLGRGCAGSCGACFGCLPAGGLLGLGLLLIRVLRTQRLAGVMVKIGRRTGQAP